MTATLVYGRIKSDLEKTWGMMANPILRNILKRMNVDESAVSRTDLVKLVEQLQQGTLVRTLGVEAASHQISRYRKWIEEEG